MVTRRSFVASTFAGVSAALLTGGRLDAGVTAGHENQWLRLSDGRKLGFATYGDPVGWPVLYFHGIPTSRIEARFYESAAASQGCRLIALDRPGYGLSSPQCGRRVVDWLQDVNEFIDSPGLPADLNLDQFSIVTFSSGAAYALLCAARLPESRLRSVAVVGGIAPLERIVGHGGYAETFFRLAERRPRVARAAFNVSTRNMHRRSRRVLRTASRFFSRPDARMFRDSRTARNLMDSYLQCVRCGPDGVAYDMSQLAKPWGYCLQDVNRKVNLWYGACDITTPPHSMGYCLDREIPNSCLHVIQGEGHLTMLDSVNDAIFAQLVADI